MTNPLEAKARAWYEAHWSFRFAWESLGASERDDLVAAYRSAAREPLERLEKMLIEQIAVYCSNREASSAHNLLYWDGRVEGAHYELALVRAELKELDALGREHPDRYSVEKVREVCGG